MRSLVKASVYTRFRATSRLDFGESIKRNTSKCLRTGEMKGTEPSSSLSNRLKGLLELGDLLRHASAGMEIGRDAGRCVKRYPRRTREKKKEA